MQIFHSYEDTISRKIIYLLLFFLYTPILLHSESIDTINVGTPKYYQHIKHLFRSNNLEELGYWLQKAEKHGIRERDTALLINTLQDYARIYFEKQELENSIKAMQRSYDLADKYQDTTILIRSIVLLGTMHSYAGNDSLALNYFLKAEYLNKIKPHEDMINTLNVNLALAYKRTEQYHKSLEYLNKSLNKMDTTNLAQYSAYHLNASSIYAEIGEFETSTYHAFEAMKMKKQIDDKKGIARATMAIAYIFSKADKPAQAISYYEEAVQFGISMNEPTLEKEAYEGLVSNYTKLKKYEYALDAHKKYHHIKDSIDQSKSILEINELKAVTLLQAKNSNLKKKLKIKSK